MAKLKYKKIGSSSSVSISPGSVVTTNTTVSRSSKDIATHTEILADFNGKSYKKTITRFTSRNHKPLGFTNILRYVIFFMLMALLIRCLSVISTGGDLSSFDNVPTLTSLLELITGIEPLKLNFLNFKTTTLGDWGAFNFLRNFFAMIVKLFDVLIFLFNGLSVIVSYLVVLLQWLFL